MKNYNKVYFNRFSKDGFSDTLSKLTCSLIVLNLFFVFL